MGPGGWSAQCSRLQHAACFGGCWCLAQDTDDRGPSRLASKDYMPQVWQQAVTHRCGAGEGRRGSGGSGGALTGALVVGPGLALCHSPAKRAWRNEAMRVQRFGSWGRHLQRRCGRQLVWAAAAAGRAPKHARDSMLVMSLPRLAAGCCLARKEPHARGVRARVMSWPRPNPPGCRLLLGPPAVIYPNVRGGATPVTMVPAQLLQQQHPVSTHNARFRSTCACAPRIHGTGHRAPSRSTDQRGRLGTTSPGQGRRPPDRKPRAATTFPPCVLSTAGNPCAARWCCCIRERQSRPRPCRHVWLCQLAGGVVSTPLLLRAACCAQTQGVSQELQHASWLMRLYLDEHDVSGSLQPAPRSLAGGGGTTGTGGGGSAGGGDAVLHAWQAH